MNINVTSNFGHQEALCDVEVNKIQMQPTDTKRLEVHIINTRDKD